MTTILALALSLLLTACSAAPVTNVQNAPPPANLLPLVSEEPITYEVELVTYQDAAQAEDGTPLASYCFQLPHLYPVRADGTAVETAETMAETQALAAAEAFNQHFGAWAAAAEFEELTEEAREDLAWRRSEGMDWQSGYTLELTCQVYQTDRLVSVSGLYYSYIEGAAHPNSWQMGWNYDLEQGDFLEPELLSGDQPLREAVTAELLRQAEQPQEDGSIPVDQYWEDYEEILANWPTAAVAFDELGMTVIFSPYELAAYGFGPQCFQVGYDYLSPYLDQQGRALLGLEEN